MDSLSDDRSSADVFALAEEAIGGVRVRLSHSWIYFVIIAADSASGGAECGKWSFSIAA